MYVLLLLAIGGVILTVGDVVFKYWTLTSKPVLYVLGIPIYLVALLFLAESYKYQHMAGASLVLTTLNTLLLVVVSSLLFREHLSPVQWVGIALGIAAVVCIQFGARAH